MFRTQKKLSATITIDEEDTLTDFLTASTRRTDSPRETEAQILMSLALALRKTTAQA